MEAREQNTRQAIADHESVKMKEKPGQCQAGNNDT